MVTRLLQDTGLYDSVCPQGEPKISAACEARKAPRGNADHLKEFTVEFDFAP
jgi:hypothetical protein